jgi:hypothetical protein
MPIPMDAETLAAVLHDMAAHVEAGDSFEGSIEYLMPAPGDPECYAMVRASYRIGNTLGQGGVRLIGTLGGKPPMAPVEKPDLDDYSGFDRG